MASIGLRIWLAAQVVGITWMISAPALAAAPQPAADALATPPARAYRLPASALQMPGPAPDHKAPLPPGAEVFRRLPMWLGDLPGRAYPERHLFEAALDARLCDQVYRAAYMQATAHHQARPPLDDVLRHCPSPNWSASQQLHREASGETAPAPHAEWVQIPWQQLAPALLPLAWRSWLIQQAQPTASLPGNRGAAWPPPASATLTELRRADDTPDWLIAQHHWPVLAAPPPNLADTELSQRTAQHAQLALALTEPEWPGRWGWLASRLPAFARPQPAAAGITLVYAQPPDAQLPPAAAERLASFHRQWLRDWAQSLQTSHRRVVINLVLTDQQLAARLPFNVSDLQDITLQIERPVPDAEVKQQANALAAGTSQVSLRWTILLSEPTTFSKKRLRKLFEATPGLHGAQRTMLLRKTYPALIMPAGPPEPFQDDLVYADDNFGGLVLWGPLDEPSKGLATAAKQRLQGPAPQGAWARYAWPLPGLALLAAIGLLWRGRQGRGAPPKA